MLASVNSCIKLFPLFYLNYVYTHKESRVMLAATDLDVY